VLQEAAGAAGKVEDLQPPLVAAAPSLGQQREGATPHGSRSPREQGFHLGLVTTGAVLGQPATGLVVEVLPVISWISSRIADVSDFCPVGFAAALVDGFG